MAHLCEGGGCHLLGPYSLELWAALCISPVYSLPGLIGSCQCSLWPQALGHCPTGCLEVRQTPLGCRCRRLAAASALGFRDSAHTCLSLQSSIFSSSDHLPAFPAAALGPPPLIRHLRDGWEWILWGLPLLWYKARHEACSFLCFLDCAEWTSHCFYRMWPRLL